MQLNTGKVVTDETLRTFIEDCVENLRIKIFQTRVKEQLRAQYPPPNRVTWKDLEAIVEVQDKLKNDAESWILTFVQEITRRWGCQYSTWEARQHGLDLKAIKNSIKKVESAVDGQLGDPESKKKVDTPPSKKIKKEVNAAERSKKQQLSNDEKDKYRVAPAPAEKKSPAGKADSLKAEYQDMVAARKTASRAGSVKSQVLSEDEGSRSSHAWLKGRSTGPNTHEVNHREVPGSGLPASSSSSVLSALAEEMGVGVLADALATINLEGLSGAQAVEDKPEVMAAPAMALGSTQQMRGFPVKTPEEFDAEAQLPLAPAADEMQRKVQLMASVIKSLRAAFRKLAAELVAEGRITAPRGVETLVELAEAGQLPMPAALAADLGNCQSCDNGDDWDGNCPDGLESGSDSDEEEIPLVRRHGV
ncbi:hypothetical protein CYMTET_50375 [Cymbomonas tetramitiformis]|uniref:Uncharacterized protein n=1 Tax=Cymbomonas tetramitiformis TaxID=36881 RepID=A0AAE0BPJ8_9CHLO|nr:hypothetical protein CYMTET_50375 [Cymbomonas tetramitiformis]